MVTVGNQGQDDRYLRLCRCNMSHPAVSRSCDCHTFLSWQITEKSGNDWIDLRMANNPSGKRRHCIFYFQYYLQTNFDPSLCNNGRGGCCIFTRIHVPSHTTTRTLRMINHRNFPRNITTFLFAALELI